MAEHPNMARMYEMRDMWNRGDVQGFLDRCADDIVTRVGGTSPLAGSYMGKQAYTEYLGLLTRLPSQVVIHDMLAGDHHGATVMDVHVTRGDGVTLDMTVAMAFRFDDEGRWTEVWYLPADQEAFDEFWAQVP